MKLNNNILIVHLLLTVFVGLKLSAQEKNKKLNVLFFLIDDLRPNLGCYGDRLAITPNIDRLARRGIVFNRAYCQQAVCNPSRTSMLTGLRPDETGVYNLQAHFRKKVPEAITLPQAFKESGYNTVGLGKVFHALSATLDSVSWTRSLTNYGGRNYVLPENLKGRGAKKNITEMPDVPDISYEDGKIAGDAVKFLSGASKSSQPFFLAVGFKKPHAPYCAPKKYWDLYQRDAFGVLNRERPKDAPAIAFHSWQELRGYRDVPDSGAMTVDQEKQIMHGYYACISYIDAQIGKVMHQLDSLGLSENTIIVLWGDHGYHLGEQDLWCKSTNFELDTRVPLIIAAPGMEGNGRNTNVIVETVDIYPTLVDLCHIQGGSNLSGKSLSLLLNNPSAPWDRVAFSQFVRPYQAINQSHAPTHIGYSVRSNEWRCTYWYRLADNGIESKELYFMGNGISETVNVSGQPQVAAIERKLAQLIERYRNAD